MRRAKARCTVTSSSTTKTVGAVLSIPPPVASIELTLPWSPHRAAFYRINATEETFTLTTSDKAAYVAHGLALLNGIRTWGVVRQGGRGTGKPDYRYR